MTREDLLAAGWDHFYEMDLADLGKEWRHPEVHDGYPYTFDEAVRAEKIRRTRDGGA